MSGQGNKNERTEFYNYYYATGKDSARAKLFNAADKQLHKTLSEQVAKAGASVQKLRLSTQDSIESANYKNSLSCHTETALPQNTSTESASVTLAQSRTKINSPANIQHYSLTLQKSRSLKNLNYNKSSTPLNSQQNKPQYLPGFAHISKRIVQSARHSS